MPHSSSGYLGAGRTVLEPGTARTPGNRDLLEDIRMSEIKDVEGHMCDAPYVRYLEKVESIKTQRRTTVARNWGRKEWGVIIQWVKFQFGRITMFWRWVPSNVSYLISLNCTLKTG